MGPVLPGTCLVALPGQATRLGREVTLDLVDELENLATEAGLIPETTFDASYPFEYSDEKTLGRLLTAPMGLAELAGPDREPAPRCEIIDALADDRTPDGGYRLHNEFHFLVARA